MKKRGENGSNNIVPGMTSMSLRTKYLIVIIGILLFMGISVVVYVDTVLSGKILIELQKRGVTIANAIARESADLILTEKIVDLQILINDYRNSEENIEYIFILNSDGEPLVHTFDGWFPVELKEANSVDNGSAFRVQSLEVENEDILDIAIPVLKGGAGYVRVGITEEPFNRDVADIIQIFVVIILLLSIFSGILAVLFAQVITRPIYELTEAARIVGDGNLDYKVPVRTKDEIGQLGVVFNNMIAERKRVEEELMDSQEQLRNLSIYLLDVREEERTSVAREIHDELGQRLTGMKMDVSWLNNNLDQDLKSRRKKLQALTKAINVTIQTVKDISSKLRPAILDDFGLTAAVEWQAKEFESRTGIVFDVQIEPEDIKLDNDRSTSIFRIFQETLTNIVRHAGATEVRMSLREDSDGIVLEVIDDGKGITNEQVTSPKSFGLIGINERVKALGGEVSIRGIPKQGTRVTVTIPNTSSKSADEGRATGALPR